MRHCQEPDAFLGLRVTGNLQSAWLGFFRHRREKQRHGSTLIGAGATGCTAPGLKTPNSNQLI